MIAEVGNVRPHDDSARPLGPFLATMIVAGYMIGSGVFMVPASLAGIGSVTILSWLLAAGGPASLGVLWPGSWR